MRPLTSASIALALLTGLVPGCDSAPEDEDGSEEPRSGGAEAAEGQPVAAAADDGPTHAATARTGVHPREATESDVLHLSRPPMRALKDVPAYQVTAGETDYRIAQAFQFDSPVFHYPNAARRISGLVRRNTRLAVDRYVPGDGCSRSWYALEGGGYVCSADGFSVSTDPAPLRESLQVGVPQMDQPLPYRYAKVNVPAPLYWRMPTESELASGSTEPIRAQAQGIHFVAIDQSTEVGDTKINRTVRGFYVREQDLTIKPEPTMHGELVDGADALPLAFVHVDEAALLDPDTGKTRGTAEKFSRFAIESVREDDGQTLVIAKDGFAVARDQVRIARVRPRPEEVPAGDKWIDIDLRQQLLVAYEGDQPVLATLVSSGIEGYEPPLGVFRIHKKYTTVTMSGPDPDKGTYEVEQVPWTMYYWGSFALHGAYWHDTFGNVRSHGCTNIPPADARWLFHWADPAVPTGWHAQVGIKGPWVHFSRGFAVDPELSR